MKLQDISEDVVDLSKRREQVQAQKQQQTAADYEHVFNKIDHAAAAAMDQLEAKGMSKREATHAVLKHMGDLITAFDLFGEFE